MKKKEGCELEARGVSYVVNVKPWRSHPFKIWSREDDEEEKDQQQREEQQDIEANQKEGEKVRPTRVRHVLKNVYCRAKPWEILAVVGPSGAGKSTLLQILAGRIYSPPSPTPLIFADGKPTNGPKLKKISGYVAQRDTVFPLLTVRETLTCAAALRLNLPPVELNNRVDSLIRELGLELVAETRVGGGDGVRGVSGGERRRVSIGVGVVHDPSVLILDEPTSGLDSAAALQVVEMLRYMAETRGRTVVLSIHQPGFRIVKILKNLLLLANGSVLYHGAVDQVHSHLCSAGLQLPVHVNAVEFAIESIDALQRYNSINSISIQRTQNSKEIAPSVVAGSGEERRQRCTLQQLFQQNKIADEDQFRKELVAMEFIGAREEANCGGFANSRLRETVILAGRFFKIVFRTKQLFVCRTLQMLAASFVLGSIFFNLEDTITGAKERVGLFAFILTFLLSCTTEALPIFLQEREILMNETTTGSYRISSYAVANALVFLPFQLILALLFSAPLYWLVGLNQTFHAFGFFVIVIWLILYTANSVAFCIGALAPNFIVGNSLISGVMGAFFLFSGYFIAKQGLPGYWVFMNYLSLFKYPFEAFLVNEFSGKCLESKDGVCLINGNAVLREEGLRLNDRWMNVVVMVGFILVYRFLAYVILRCRCRWSENGGSLRRKALG